MADDVQSDATPDLPPVEQEVTDDVGGVQGSDPDEGDDVDATAAAATQTAVPGTAPSAPAPDAGEIEWAGGAVSRPPAPDR